LLCGYEGVNVKEKERVVLKYMNMYSTLTSGGKDKLIVQLASHILTYDTKSFLKEMITKMKINLKKKSLFITRFL
jgi:hypothetical protein